MKTKNARLAEAYELLWEECQLEAYLRHHPTDEDQVNADAEHSEDAHESGIRSEEDSNDEESDNDDEGSVPIVDSSELASSNACAHETRNEPIGEDQGEEGWTEAELSIFFTSLARRSGLFPDLISQDMDYVKSTSQIAQLLSRFKSESRRQDLQKSMNDEKSQATRVSRKIRAIKMMRGAHEVSDEWLAFEEQMAAKLSAWQVTEDAETDQAGHLGPEDGVGETSKEPANDDGQADVVDWDTQVLNTLLYLRHHPATSPDLNEANCFLSEGPSSMQEEPKSQLFYFHASIVPSLFNSKDQSTSYRSFARCHPVPSIKSRNLERTKQQQQHFQQAMTTEILYRGVELGILARIGLSQSDDESEARAKILDRGGVGGNLIWLDTIPHQARRADAARQLRVAREAAAQRLMNTLRWKEARAVGILLRSEDRKDEQSIGRKSRAFSMDEKEQIQAYISQCEKPPSSYAERNRLISRIKGRIKRYGIQAALEMPLEAQAVGRKRKSDEEDSSASSKKVRMDEDSVSQGISAEGEDEHFDEVPLKRDLIRFRQAGVTITMIQALLSQPARTGLDLFDVSSLLHIIQGQSQEHPEADRFVPAHGFSLRSLASLVVLLQDFLTTLIASSLEVASSIRSEAKEVTAEHVRVAVSQQSTPRAVHDTCFAADHVLALQHFRSDPPRIYTPTSTQRYNLALQLQGLKNLSASRHLFDTEGSITRDVVITMTDAFTLPISSQFAPQMKSSLNNGVTQIDSDSDESSIYDDSEQEEEIAKRRDEKRGAEREEKVDGRVWDSNQKRAGKEAKRWNMLEEDDMMRAQRHEKRLWASVGLKRIKDEVEKEQIVQSAALKEDEDGDHISLSSDDSETDSDGSSSESLSSDAGEEGSSDSRAVSGEDDEDGDL